MSSTLAITTIQTHLYWENIDENLWHFSQKINAINEQTDIIILPEMFTTGFTMKPEQLAENHTNSKGLSWMITIAKQKKCLVIGSISIKDDKNYYNRLYVVKPNGSNQYYDKKHLFSMGNEPIHYTSGNKKLIVDYKGWKICPLICYDLRFPVWSRNDRNQPYDLLIYVANWPEVRNFAWKHLLIARAIENQCYIAAVNRIGKDGNDINHSGDSCILNAKGELLSKTTAYKDCIETTQLSYEQLHELRKKFPVLNDGDKFNLIE